MFDDSEDILEVIDVSDFDDDQKQLLWSWLTERLDELEAEREEVEDEMGDDFLPCLRGLVVSLTVVDEDDPSAWDSELQSDE